MSNSLTVRELLNGGIEGFDPLNADTTEIRELSNAFPKDNNLDVNNAEVLATKCLKACDLCSEMMAISVAHASKMETLKKKAYAEAALNKATAAQVKTDKSRAWFAEMDVDFIDASNKYSEAIAFVKWISSKYESFTKMHYFCKKILDRAYPHEHMANFGGQIERDIVEPKEEDGDEYDLGW